jgi:hypothetical protein
MAMEMEIVGEVLGTLGIVSCEHAARLIGICGVRQVRNTRYSILEIVYIPPPCPPIYIMRVRMRMRIFSFNLVVAAYSSRLIYSSTKTEEVTLAAAFSPI